MKDRSPLTRRSAIKSPFPHAAVGSQRDSSPTPEEADVWLAMIDDRNLTAHAYDEALANRIYGHITRDYAPLLGSMARKTQTLEGD